MNSPFTLGKNQDMLTLIQNFCCLYSWNSLLLTVWLFSYKDFYMKIWLFLFLKCCSQLSSKFGLSL